MGLIAARSAQRAVRRRDNGDRAVGILELLFDLGFDDFRRDVRQVRIVDDLCCDADPRSHWMVVVPPRQTPGDDDEVELRLALLVFDLEHRQALRVELTFSVQKRLRSAPRVAGTASAMSADIGHTSIKTRERGDLPEIAVSGGAETPLCRRAGA